MTQSVTAASLLEHIQALASLDYLSDLHDAKQRKRVLSVIHSIPAEQFSAEDWYEAAAYILTAPVDFGTAAYIRQQLLLKLQ